MSNVRQCSLPSTFHNDMFFFPLCWTRKPGEQWPRVKNPTRAEYVYLKPHLIPAEESLSSLTAIVCTWLRRLGNALLMKGVVMGRSLSGSTTKGAEVLLLEITYRRSRSKGCPEASDGAALWAAGSWLSCILPVVSCCTLWLTEHP